LDLLITFTSQLQALVDKTKLNPSDVGDIVVGTVLAPGSQRAIECRMAALYAGFPGNEIVSVASSYDVRPPLIPTLICLLD
jgi:acetyl-CoA acetyltransferase